MIHLYDDIYIGADKLNFMTFSLREVKTGKQAGKQVQENHKFYPNLEILMKGLVTHEMIEMLRDEDLESLQEMEIRFKKLSNVFRKMSNRVGSTRNLFNNLTSDESVELEDVSDEPEPEPKKKKKRKITKLKKIKIKKKTNA